MINMVYAIDPGKTTGLVSWIRGRINTCTVTDVKELWHMIALKPDLIIYERFATGGRISVYGLETIELCGGIEALCYVLEINSARHTPSQRTPFQKIAHDYMKQNFKNFAIHEEDALAHLLRWAHHTKFDLGVI